MQQSDECSPDDPVRGTKLTLAAQYYKLAADLNGFTDDDYLYSHSLRQHLDCLVALKRPLRETLAVCQRIRLAIPEALEIWGNAAVGESLREILEEVTGFEEKYTKMMADGECTQDSVGELEPMTEQMDHVEQVSAPSREAPKARTRRPDVRRENMKDLLKKI